MGKLKKYQSISTYLGLPLRVDLLDLDERLFIARKRSIARKLILHKLMDQEALVAV